MIPPLTRRDVMRAALVTIAAALARAPLSAFGAPDADDELVPFLDPQPMDPKRPMLQWDQLRDWITPAPQFFDVSHYHTAQVDAATWRLGIEGQVQKPVSFSLDELKARPRKELTATLECSGNGASRTFMGAIGNARWAGTPLAPLLKECGIGEAAIEVAFWGADSGKEKIHDQEVVQNFARSLPLKEAQRDDILLAWEMNGAPLTPGHGFPLRLVVPGWYGIAWAKWLTRIEVRDRRLMNRFMARDYVTFRGKQVGDQVVWTETSVGPMNVKSLVARVVRRKDGTLLISGAAWTKRTPLKSVELQIDASPWLTATIDAREPVPHAWTFWSYEWKNPPAGEHTLVSRATDIDGHVQPAADDPAIKLKKTYYEANAQLPRKIRI